MAMRKFLSPTQLRVTDGGVLLFTGKQYKRLIEFFKLEKRLLQLKRLS